MYTQITSFLTLLLLATNLNSCSSTGHQLQGNEVKVLVNKPSHCISVGNVVGKHEDGSLDLARNQAINKAYELGANSIYFTEELSNGPAWTSIGIGYRCN